MKKMFMAYSSEGNKSLTPEQVAFVNEYVLAEYERLKASTLYVGDLSLPDFLTRMPSLQEEALLLYQCLSPEGTTSEPDPSNHAFVEVAYLSMGCGATASRVPVLLGQRFRTKVSVDITYLNDNRIRLTLTRGVQQAIFVIYLDVSFHGEVVHQRLELHIGGTQDKTQLHDVYGVLWFTVDGKEINVNIPRVNGLKDY